MNYYIRKESWQISINWKPMLAFSILPNKLRYYREDWWVYTADTTVKDVYLNWKLK